MTPASHVWLHANSCRARGLSLPDVKVQSGEALVLQGPSGCGKTTLLLVLAGLLEVQAGEVARDPASHHRLAFVAQQGGLVHALDAMGNLMLAQHLAKLPVDVRAAQQALDRLGVAACAKLKPGQCSRGQQQRIAVARALVQEPQVLLLDEPTANLDDLSARQLLEVLGSWCSSQPRAIVITTHDPRVLTHLQTHASTVRALTMAQGARQGVL
jgi:putative ABC transport system ATP-binding protein